MIKAQAISRLFGGRAVLRDLELSVASSDCTALSGPNGSGKTTLLRCILGTLTPDSGTITIDGHPAGSIEARRITGASLSQERSFYLRLTGRENLLLFARLRGATKAAAATEIDALVDELALTDIAAQRADRCSSGQLQQLAFARALIGSPTALLLDEPTRSLDSDARDRLWAALERRPEAAVIMATHLDEDIARCTSVFDLGAARASA